MSQINLKAFVVSNLLQLGLSIVIAGAAILATVVLGQRMGWHPSAGAGIWAFGGAGMLSAGLSLALSSLIAGFVAGRIAKYRPVLHGALSGCFSLVQALYAAAHSGSLGMPSRALSHNSLSLALAFAALLFGALGGYLAAQTGAGASRYDVAPEPPARFFESGFLAKFALALLVTVSISAFILFSPTIFCHGGGAGGNCGEGYMVSIPAAMLLSPFILAGAVFLI